MKGLSSKRIEPYSVVTDGNEYRFVCADGKTLSLYGYQSYKEAAMMAKGTRDAAARTAKFIDPDSWTPVTEEVKQ